MDDLAAAAALAAAAGRGGKGSGKGTRLLGLPALIERRAGGHPRHMTEDRGRTEHTEEPAEGGVEEGEEAEARVREQQENDDE